MNHATPSASSAPSSPSAQALRRDAMDKLRPKARQMLNDTRLDPLRPLGRRRGLVIASYLLFAATVTAAWFDLGWLLILGLVASWGAMSLLRRVVRAMADLPEELIDERMLSVRNRAYRWAYALFSAALAVAVSLLMLRVDILDIPMTFTGAHVTALLWALLLSMITLPSAVIAWTEREI